MIHETSMFQVQQPHGHEAAHVPTRRKGKCVRTLVRFVRSHLGLARGGRAGREEPPPPAAAGTHLRTVSSIDGTVTYVRVDPKVSNGSCSGSVYKPPSLLSNLLALHSYWGELI